MRVLLRIGGARCAASSSWRKDRPCGHATARGSGCPVCAAQRHPPHASYLWITTTTTRSLVDWCNGLLFATSWPPHVSSRAEREPSFGLALVTRATTPGLTSRAVCRTGHLIPLQASCFFASHCRWIIRAMPNQRGGGQSGPAAQECHGASWDLQGPASFFFASACACADLSFFCSHQSVGALAKARRTRANGPSPAASCGEPRKGRAQPWQLL